MPSLFDRYLLFRLQTKRDERAFADLYDRYIEAIYRFVYLKLSSKEMAEDIAAETFLRFWQFLQDSRIPVGNARALLYKIARNLVIDTYRKNRAQGETSVTFSEVGTSSSSEEAVAEIASDQSSGRFLMEAQADIALVLQKLGRLKEDYRDVLLLRLVDDLAFGDIARILEKTTGHVRVIYHRALKALDALDQDQKKKSDARNPDQIFFDPSS